MKRSVLSRALKAAAAGVAVLAVGGCAATASGASALPGATPRHAAPSKTPARRPGQPAKVTVRHVLLHDGHLITVARFTGSLKFVLHCGSVDPGWPRRASRSGAIPPGLRGLQG